MTKPWQELLIIFLRVEWYQYLCIYSWMYNLIPWWLSTYHSVRLDPTPGCWPLAHFSTGKQLIPMQPLDTSLMKVGQGTERKDQYPLWSYLINLSNSSCFDTHVVLCWPKTRKWLWRVVNTHCLHEKHMVRLSTGLNKPNGTCGEASSSVCKSPQNRHSHIQFCRCR